MEFGPVKLGGIEGRGFLQVLPSGMLKECRGECEFHPDHLPALITAWTHGSDLEYTGPVYNHGRATVETCTAFIHRPDRIGDVVRVSVVVKGDPYATRRAG